MSAEPYRLAAETLGPAEIDAAKSVLDSGLLTMGTRVQEFEAQFARWIGMNHAVMVNSGSSANLIMVDTMLRGTGFRPILEPGDEVIVPGLAWPTTVWPIAQLGLVPVFADIDPVTLGLDLDSAAALIGPRTRGMFIIHPLGRALNSKSYADLCAAKGLTLIEDCCESLGAHTESRHVGSAGLSGSFSFYFSHHISTIEGGMVTTDDPDLANDLRGLRAHGWVRDRTDRDGWVSNHPELDPRFLFATVGYNLRPTEIQGAIGSVQLSRLDDMLAARESLARSVNEWLERSAPWLRLIGADKLFPAASGRRERTHSWMTLPMRLSSDAPIRRNEVVDHFERHGVETRQVIAGNLARHPAVAQVPHRIGSSMENCDALLANALMIGCHPVASSGSLATLESAIAALADY